MASKTIEDVEKKLGELLGLFIPKSQAEKEISTYAVPIKGTTASNALSGPIYSGSEFPVISKSNSQSLYVGAIKPDGTSSVKQGAYITFHGNGISSTSKGCFSLGAFMDSSHAYELTGNPNGELKWGNNLVLYENINDGKVELNGVNVSIKHKVINGSTSIFGGSTSTNGASLTIYGGEYDGSKGRFSLSANNGTSNASLVGTPEGNLTWGGLNVITSSGGTFSGGLVFNTSDHAIKRLNESSSLVITGGTSQANGSSLFLSGQGNAGNGSFELIAQNSSNQSTLKGTPAGALTWRGLNVVTGPLATVATSGKYTDLTGRPGTATSSTSVSVDNPAVVTKVYENGSSWYRKWSDGWVEQGGCVVNGSTAAVDVALLLPMKSATYPLVLSPHPKSNFTDEFVYRHMGYSKTTSGFTVFFNSSFSSSDWYIAGYGAE